MFPIFSIIITTTTTPKTSNPRASPEFEIHQKSIKNPLKINYKSIENHDFYYDFY